MSQPESAFNPGEREAICQANRNINARQTELKLIFEDPPDLATAKDLIIDHYLTNFQWWSGNPEPEERRDTTGLTPLAAAVKLGNVEGTKRLIDEGARADVCSPAFGSLPHLAVALHDPGIHKIFPLLKLVIEAGADPNAPGPEPERESLLCMVIRTIFLPNYRHAICRFLIEDARVDVNARSQSGTYPIIIATEIRDRAIVHYLIQHGADVNVSDGQGIRPVHHTVDSVSSNRCIGPLLKAGADLLPRDNYGRTPLHFWGSHCHWGVLRYFTDFLPQGYDINVKDDDGWTPLMWACKNTRSDALTIKILVLHYGADIWPISYDGQWSALKLANYTNVHKEIKKILEPPEDQRQRILEDGTKQVWNPKFHEIAPGEHHDYNGCSNCKTVSRPPPIFETVADRFCDGAHAETAL
ncbi:hypothetical protein NM208_g8193 [Fusarium decemcellulare]|uniref:Uncharacterized protein n=1 Tax=Fusarium decemcellulare TaxID=57161 RepID=A0ACC1S6C7_9HYPO|nr:hypothetical protein NM208_g8193 [Fusarium decemcellulare]